MATELKSSPIHLTATAVVARRVNSHWAQALKNALLIPVFPLCGYLLLDQTGISSTLVKIGIIPQAMLGEGFGHVGLCFSIHYLAAAVQSLWKGFRLSR